MAIYTVRSSLKTSEVCCCLKETQTRLDLLSIFYFVVVSRIQRISCQPENTTIYGGQPRPSSSAKQGKENKRKRLAAYPPPPSTPHIARSEKNKIK